MLFSYNHLFVKIGFVFLPAGLGVDGALKTLDSLRLDRPNDVDEPKLGLRPPSPLPLLITLWNRELADGDSGDDSRGFPV